MRQSGDWKGTARLTRADLLGRLRAVIAALDVNQIRQEADRFVRDKAPLSLWSRE